MSAAAPGAQRLEGQAALAAAMLALAQQARRELLLQTFDFSSRLYGSEEFVDTVKRMVLADERARLRVLINQPRTAMLGAHRLIELGRLLPSRIEFRELLEDRLPSQRGDCLIADVGGFVERSDPAALHARAVPDDPLETRQRRNAFELLWDESPVAQELRKLGL